MAIALSTLPAAKGRWVRTNDAALLMRKGLGSGRDWDSWLREDRRERYTDCSHIDCYRVGENIFYDSADVIDLIEGIRLGRVNPKHGRCAGKIAEPLVQKVKASGIERVRITTNGRALDRAELRKLIFQLAEEYKCMPVPGASCA